MKRRHLFAALPAAAMAQPRGRRPPSFAGRYPALAKDDTEKKILSVLDAIEAGGQKYLGVPTVDGRWLRVLAESAGAKSVVEIGTSTGYSGLWFALALARIGGKLTTFEFDSGRAETARRHFQQAGAAGFITVVEGDAHRTLARHAGPFDVAFIDADKEGYVDYLQQLLPKIRPGGLILAHNIGMNAAYVEAVATNPALETVYFMDGGELGVTLKKR